MNILIRRYRDSICIYKGLLKCAKSLSFYYISASHQMMFQGEKEIVVTGNKEKVGVIIQL